MKPVKQDIFITTQYVVISKHKIKCGKPAENKSTAQQLAVEFQARSYWLSGTFEQKKLTLQLFGCTKFRKYYWYVEK